MNVEKVINNFKCYIATISDSEQAKNAKVGDNVQVMLSNNKTIDATIQYISQENDDETLLVLEIDKQIEEFTNYRKISFNLIWWSYSGLKSAKFCNSRTRWIKICCKK